MKTTDIRISGAAALLQALSDHEIDHVFSNAGTDFAPIIEAIVAMNNDGVSCPHFVTVPHETVAVSMAHGHCIQSGKTSAAMVHTTVGTANAAMGVINAARDNIPLLLLAGRTPVSQTGQDASRTGHIHWGQESFDQGGMIREYTKWDYECRHGQPIAEVINRAVRIANTAPCGPVYVVLPREILAEPAIKSTFPPLLTSPRPPCANPDDIREVLELIQRVNHPVIATSFAGRNVEAGKQLAVFAKHYAIPVVQPFARYVNLPSTHDMHVGYDSKPWIEQADLVLVVDCDVPFIPKFVTTNPDTKIVHISADPAFSRIPFRSFPSSIDIAGDTEQIFIALNSAAQTAELDTISIERRRKDVAKFRKDKEIERNEIIHKYRDNKLIAPSWLAHCLTKAMPDNSIVVNELGVPLDFLSFSNFGSLIGTGVAGGLGQALGAALGVKLANRENTVISVIGNGSYIFGAPTAYHHVADVENLPILTIIQNNSRWQAVDESTRSVYPDGHAAASANMPLVDLDPSPDFSLIAKASNSWAETVTHSSELPDALSEALNVVRSGRQALLNAITGIAGPRQA